MGKGDAKQSILSDLHSKLVLIDMKSHIVQSICRLIND